MSVQKAREADNIGYKGERKGLQNTMKFTAIVRAYLQSLAHALNQISNVKARKCKVWKHVIVHSSQHQGANQVRKIGFRQTGAKRVT